MSSSRCVVVAALFFFLFIATGCGSSHRSTPPDTSAGDTTAGDTTAGDTTPGDSTTGDSTTGDTAPGDTAPGDAVGGETTVPDTTVADMQGADTGASGGTLPAPVKVIADPGLGPNASFQEIVGQLSDNGAVILNAEIGGTDVTLGTGGVLVSDQTGTPVIALRQGDPMPTTPPGGTIERVFRVDGNDTKLLVGLTTASFNGVSTLLFGPSFALIGTEYTSQAPGTGDYYESFQSLRLNASGYVAFYASLSGENQSPACGTCIGIFGGDGATIGPIALRDEPAPGLDPSISLAGFFSEGLALSRDGKVAFRAYLKGPGVTGTNQTAIYFGASGTLALVARQGQSVDSTTLGALSPPSVNADGQVVFESANSVWLWSSDKGLARVAAVGGTLDGGGTITRIWDHPQLGANGRILIDAEIDDTPALLLWDGTLKVVVKVGDPAPGVDGTPSIASLHGINMLNAKGQVVFGGSLETDDVVITTENRDCLWITDPSGTPHLVLRTEGTLALGPFDVRQVTEWKLSEEDGETYGFGPRESGYPSSFNDKGELGVVVRFLDGLLAYVVSRVE